MNITDPNLVVPGSTPGYETALQQGQRIHDLAADWRKLGRFGMDALRLLGEPELGGQVDQFRLRQLAIKAGVLILQPDGGARISPGISNLMKD